MRTKMCRPYCKTFHFSILSRSKFSTTTVLGKVDEIEFKASGKEILDEGWRVVYNQETEKQTVTEATENNENAERTLPTFVKGEKGEHSPTLTEKQTVPPK